MDSQTNPPSVQPTDPLTKAALDAAIWVTCSPHEWVWTNEQQVAMARYCLVAVDQLIGWKWLTEMNCTVKRHASPPWEPQRWCVLDVDGDLLGLPWKCL